MLKASQLNALQEGYRDEPHTVGDIVVYLVFITLYMPMTSETGLSYISLSRAEADEKAKNGYMMVGGSCGITRTEYVVEEHLTNSKGYLYRELKNREEIDKKIKGSPSVP